MFRPSKKPPAAEAAVITAPEADSAFAIFSPYSSLLLAVSGGSDSMALLQLAHEWRARQGHTTKLVVASIDHRLRDASKDECEFVAAFCAARNIPHVQLHWEGAKPASGIQEAARQMRYRLLIEAARAQGCEAIVTAHTMDDQAETVLMRLMRGSGLSGLQGMSTVSEKEGLPLLRPLLVFPRERLRVSLRAAGLSWREDASNEDARFLRPRLRKILPQLAEEGLDATRFVKLAKKFARANEALDEGARQLLASSKELERTAYRTTPEEIRLRALKLVIASFNPDAYPPSDEELEALDAALTGEEKVRRTLGGVIFSAGERYMRFSEEKGRRK